MQQAPALVSLLHILHGRSPQLSFGMYTGYTRKELDEGRYKTYFSNRGEVTTPFMRTALWERVEALLDFAVMGRYNQLQPIRTTLRASRNQTLELFSDRYSLENFSKESRGREPGRRQLHSDHRLSGEGNRAMSEIPTFGPCED